MTAIALVSEHASPLAVPGTRDASGQNMYVACLATALATRGHDVTVYTRRDDASLPECSVVRAGAVGSYRVVHVTAGPARHVDMDRRLAYMDDFAAELRRWFELDRPDVVHSHFWMSGYAAFAAAGAVQAPLVHTFHALGTVERRHQGVDDRSPAERIGMEHQLLRHADKVVATSSDEVAELRRMAGGRTAPRAAGGGSRSPGRPATGDTSPATSPIDALPVPSSPTDELASDEASSRVVVVPCGYDAQVFRPDGQRLPRSTRPMLAAVSRLIPRNGLDTVLRALSCLPDAELVVAGGPPLARLPDDPYVLDLLALADDLRVRDRVRFVGGVGPAAVAAIDRTADLFVAAPRYESFGIAPVEAMACGTPVVTTAVGGMLDTVIEGGTGSLVPVDDPEALAAGVRALIDAPARLVTTGDRAAWRTRRRYAWNIVARAMDDVYREVVGGAVAAGDRARTGSR